MGKGGGGGGGAAQPQVIQPEMPQSPLMSQGLLPAAMGRLAAQMPWLQSGMRTIDFFNSPQFTSAPMQTPQFNQGTFNQMLQGQHDTARHWQRNLDSFFPSPWGTQLSYEGMNYRRPTEPGGQAPQGPPQGGGGQQGGPQGNVPGAIGNHGGTFDDFGLPLPAGYIPPQGGGRVNYTQGQQGGGQSQGGPRNPDGSPNTNPGGLPQVHTNLFDIPMLQNIPGFRM